MESLGSAYSLGFLRSYAKLVDLEPDDIIKNYKLINREKNIKFDYNFPGVIKEKKSFFPVIALFTFLFSLVVYSSWYYLNINNLESNKTNIANLDNDNSNLDYVKIEDNIDVHFGGSFFNVYVGKIQINYLPFGYVTYQILKSADMIFLI